MDQGQEGKSISIIDLFPLIADKKLMLSEQFIPWNNGFIQGVYRKLTFTRGSLLGEISKYHFEDYIIWKYQYPDDFDRIRKKWGGKPDTFLSRFVFLHPTFPFKYQRKSIWLGLRGYIDLIICPFPISEQDFYPKEIYDLIPFFEINKANQSENI
ncbi:MAG TPA: hypothetical protein PLX23_08565 [Candidatus Hydrogenedens sp.]|nr:hypothetical protein [Candidatus Hydrogenedens sp.]